VRLAYEVFLFQNNLIREGRARHDAMPTFMAKPICNDPASAITSIISCGRDNGKNTF